MRLYDMGIDDMVVWHATLRCGALAAQHVSFSFRLPTGRMHGWLFIRYLFAFVGRIACFHFIYSNTMAAVEIEIIAIS